SGLIVIRSRRARDEWKFRANRFGPGFRSTSGGGIRVESYNPRFELGGPIVKDRVWLEQTGQARFFVGDVQTRAESEQSMTKAVSSFTRVDGSLSRRHLLVATVGMFPSYVDNATVSTFTPPEASVNIHVFGKQAALS